MVPGTLCKVRPPQPPAVPAHHPHLDPPGRPVLRAPSGGHMQVLPCDPSRRVEQIPHTAAKGGPLPLGPTPPSGPKALSGLPRPKVLSPVAGLGSQWPKSHVQLQAARYNPGRDSQITDELVFIAYVCPTNAGDILTPQNGCGSPETQVYLASCNLFHWIQPPPNPPERPEGGREDVDCQVLGRPRFPSRHWCYVEEGLSQLALPVTA